MTNIDSADEEKNTPLSDERKALEAEIAKREANLSIVRRERRERLRDGGIVAAAMPHRNWHLYALGADLVDCGLHGKDALALMGLRSLPVPRLVRILLAAHDEAPGTYLGRLLPQIIDHHRDELHARGLAVSWQRRWVRYQTDLTSWQAQSDDVKNGSWRDAPMNVDQRELVRITATLLDRPIPVGLRCGTAADWLGSNHANLNYTKEY